MGQRMSEFTVVVLEWHFSPPDYFGEATVIPGHDCNVVIDNGKAEARLASAVYDADPSLRAVLHEKLKDRFLTHQFFRHQPYELSKLSVAREYPDGRRDVEVELVGQGLKLSVGDVGVRIADREGSVLSDSKRERIDEEKMLAELISTYRRNDGVLDSVLNSYTAAVRDPDNELVHLYEIQDAIKTKFRGRSAALLALRIKSCDWQLLGRLCNDNSLRQGRHRGRSIDGLRDATEAELAEARGIARAMVKAYLQYLRNSGPTHGSSARRSLTSMRLHHPLGYFPSGKAKTVSLDGAVSGIFPLDSG